MKKQIRTSLESPSPLPRLGNLAGHERVLGLLERAMKEDRLFPALLFHGPPGIGKHTAAWAVAAALNCMARQNGDACGDCRSCRKIASFSHPDVKILESGQAAALAGRPLQIPPVSAPTTNRPAARLLIGQVRRLIKEIACPPYEGRRRVILVSNLESDPTMGCANALLKVLEEPPSRTIFILISGRPDRLPETIRSRCQALPFMPLSMTATAALLEGRGLPPPEARLRAAMCGGCPGMALNMEDQGKLILRDQILEALARSVKGPAAALRAAEDLPVAREDLQDLLSTLALVARDLMIAPFSTSMERWINLDRKDFLTRLAALIPASRAAYLLERIAWCQQAAERNLTPALMIQTLLLQAGGHLPVSSLESVWLEEEPGEAARL
ncbi:MAG: ATP-binding protein [Acidobacteriota bacterium]